MAVGEDERDVALARLEDVLAALPFDRALPGLPDLLRAAEVDEDYLLADDRARKVLHEAVVARPLGSREVIDRFATEVEVLTLEVEVLGQRLAAPATPDDVRAAAAARLTEVRARLQDVKRLL